MNNKSIERNLNEYGIHHINGVTEQTSRLCYDQYFVREYLIVSDNQFLIGIDNLFFIMNHKIDHYYKSLNGLIKITGASLL